jgi:cell division protein FtsI/penicillin-binding protein 2
MSGRQRRRLDERSWCAVMRRFDASGQTVSGFCEREGLCVSSFYRWRERAGQSRSEVTSAQPLQARTPFRQSSDAGFIDLGRLSDSPGATLGAAASGLEIRLELGAGVVLHLVRR